MTEELHTPEHIAAILNVKVTTVRRWLREKKLIGIRIGRMWRIEQSQLDALLKRGGLE